MKSTSAAAVAAASLAVGVVFGYLVPRSQEALPAAPAESAKDDGAAAARLRERAAALSAEAERLKAEVERLKAEAERRRKELDERAGAGEAEPQESVTEKTVAVTKTGEDGSVRVVTNPEEAKKIKSALGKMLKNAKVEVEDAQDKSVEFLNDIDTDWMSEDELAVHNDLLALIQRKKDMDREMVENLFSKGASSMSIADRLKLNDDLRAAYAQERDALLRRTADLLGYSGEDSNTFVSTVKEIYDATTLPEGGAIKTKVSLDASGVGEELLKALGGKDAKPGEPARTTVSE